MSSISSPRRLLLVSDPRPARPVIRRYRLARVGGDRRTALPAARKPA